MDSLHQRADAAPKWQFIADAIAPAGVPGGAPIRRLLVLFPNGDLNESALANALWQLSARFGAEVVLVALSRHFSDEPQIRRRAALVTALLRESGICAHTVVQHRSDWVQVARDLYVPGDLVVSHAGQRQFERLEGLGSILAPLSALLARRRMPVCELDGVLRPRPDAQNFLRLSASWVLPFAIIIASFVLQAVFLHVAQHWAMAARQFVVGVYSLVELASIAWLAKSR